MQASFHKYLIFLLLLGSFLMLPRVNAASEDRLHTADSLFTIGQYSRANAVYKSVYNKRGKFSPSLLIKLSYLAEKGSKPTEALYYMSALAAMRPSVDLLVKMDKIAATHHLTGYEFNDFSYFKIYYNRYGGYVPMLLLTLGAYIVLVMVFKVRRHELIQKNHKWAVVAYLLALLALFNLPANYESGVVKSEVTYVRAFPSAAAPVALTIRKGHKLTIIGSRDEWSRVLWDRKIWYILKSDLWIV